MSIISDSMVRLSRNSRTSNDACASLEKHMLPIRAGSTVTPDTELPTGRPAETPDHCPIKAQAHATKSIG